MLLLEISQLISNHNIGGFMGYIFLIIWRLWHYDAVSLQQLSFLLSAVVQTLCRWIITIKRNYRPIPGHDWSHAVLTMQTLFVMLQVCRLFFATPHSSIIVIFILLL